GPRRRRRARGAGRTGGGARHAKRVSGWPGAKRHPAATSSSSRPTGWMRRLDIEVSARSYRASDRAARIVNLTTIHEEGLRAGADAAAATAAPSAAAVAALRAPRRAVLARRLYHPDSAPDILRR